ncbi:MAG: hypothetical protein KAJ58_01120 [Candidatus Pacebacteria bacterium]|nr:hypothetical protein [Candidatus Paceibacterota bacterium]
MKKCLEVFVAVVMFLFLCGSVSAEYIVRTCEVPILPATGAFNSEYQVVVKDSLGNLARGIPVAGRFLEHFGNPGVLGETQRTVTDQYGVATFTIPDAPRPTDKDSFWYFSVWADSDLYCLYHQVIWWTVSTALPAYISFGDFGGVVPLQTSMDCLVTNAWGVPLPNLTIEIIDGAEYFSSVFAITDVDGVAHFSFTAGSAVGSAKIKAQVEFLPFARNTTDISWGTPQPNPVLSGDNIVAQTGLEYGLPVFRFSQNRSGNAGFTLLDEDGNPIVGEQVECLYPVWSGVTDSNGEFSVLIPASGFIGWDVSWVWVVSDPDTTLNFKMVYE